MPCRGGPESHPYPHRPLLADLIKYQSDTEAGKSFGLRHLLSPGLVPEIQEEDLRSGGDPGTSGTDGSGNLRGVRYWGFGIGTAGGTYPPSGLVSAESLDWGGGPNHKEPERAGFVPRVPEFEEKAVKRGDMGGRVLCPDGGRPTRDGVKYQRSR